MSIFLGLPAASLSHPSGLDPQYPRYANTETEGEYSIPADPSFLTLPNLRYGQGKRKHFLGPGGEPILVDGGLEVLGGRLPKLDLDTAVMLGGGQNRKVDVMPLGCELLLSYP